MTNSKRDLVFIGTYTDDILFGTGEILHAKGEGIYVYNFDPSSGELEFLSVADAGSNPSYMAFDPSHHFLYAVNELKEFEGEPGGAVSAFSLDQEAGSLTFLDRQKSHGTDPCHLIVDNSGQYVLVANFSSGTVTVLPIQPDGLLGEATCVIQHQGSSLDPVRQTRAHAHSVVMDDSGEMLFVPDLGMDKVMIYKLNHENGTLKSNDVPWFKTRVGAGPRQLVINSTGDLFYLINELNSTITVLKVDQLTGSLEEIQTITTLPIDFNGNNICAEIQLSPSGKYLYASNRGCDSIVVYSIEPVTGLLSCLGHEGTQGKTPRNFCIDPRGAFLLVANQDSDTVVSLSIDPGTGKLNATGQVTRVPNPVCVKFLKN